MLISSNHQVPISGSRLQPLDNDDGQIQVVYEVEVDKYYHHRVGQPKSCVVSEPRMSNYREREIFQKRPMSAQ